MRTLVATFIAGTLALVGSGTGAVRADDETKVDAHVVWAEVHFDFDSATLSDAARAQLDKAAAWLADNPDAVILIEGHADKKGPAPYNKRLAERRAEAARAYLAGLGVSEAQVRVLSYGEGLPAIDTPKANRLNRRIVLTAIEKEPIIETRTETVTKTVEVPVEEKVYVPRTVEVIKPVPAEQRPLDLDLMAGGGVTGFIAEQTRDAADIGGLWSARVVGRTDHYLGYEAAYVGSSQGINVAGADPEARLYGNGFEGALRLNFTRRAAWQPYVFGGIGLAAYDVSHLEASMNTMYEDDDVVLVPAGVGLRVELPARLVLDVRGTYRAAFEDTMLDRMGGDNGLESWATAGQLGLRF